MSELNDLIKTVGDEAKDKIKTELLSLIQDAKQDVDELAQETAKKLESWLVLKLQGEIDNDELQAFIEARKRTVLQQLNAKEITTKARVEKLTIGLFDLVVDKAINAIV